jgi:Fe-S cluster assembly protein SufD
MSAAQYVEHYQRIADILPGQNLPWLSALRQLALGSFAATGFPSPRDEEWKYTNVSALERKLFQPLLPTAAEEVNAALVETHKLADTYCLVLVNGCFDANLSNIANLPDSITATGLSDALQRFPDKVKVLLNSATAQESHGFIAFNTAYFSDGGFIQIPAASILPKPIQILHISTQAEALANTRNLIGLGDNAEAKIIETFVGSVDSGYLNAAITEISLGENAGLEHYKIQVESAKAYHFGGVYARLARSSRFIQHNLSFGGLLARHEIHANLDKGSECELNGLFLAASRQHVDNHTLIHHVEPQGTSRETYRGVLAEKSRGIFQGRIIVHPKAQKTSAEMNNRNLLLSDDAEIDAKPQLEILADDVKCSHGVSIGQLDPESIFYLISRGVDSATARNMLTFAFANEMVEKISLNSLRERVQGHLLDRFPQTGIRRDWL